MTNKRFFMGLSLLVFLGFLPGCAAILGGGSSTPVHFASDPDGAAIYDNGLMIGKTPTIVKLNKKKDHTIEFKRDGFENLTHLIGTSVGAGWVVADVLLSGAIGVIVDAATGSWMGLDDDNIRVTLEKK